MTPAARHAKSERTAMTVINPPSGCALLVARGDKTANMKNAISDATDSLPNFSPSVVLGSWLINFTVSIATPIENIALVHRY